MKRLIFLIIPVILILNASLAFGATPASIDDILSGNKISTVISSEEQKKIDEGFKSYSAVLRTMSTLKIMQTNVTKKVSINFTGDDINKKYTQNITGVIQQKDKSTAYATLNTSDSLNKKVKEYMYLFDGYIYYKEDDTRRKKTTLFKEKASDAYKLSNPLNTSATVLDSTIVDEYYTFSNICQFDKSAILKASKSGDETKATSSISYNFTLDVTKVKFAEKLPFDPSKVTKGTLTLNATRGAKGYLSSISYNLNATIDAANYEGLNEADGIKTITYSETKTSKLTNYGKVNIKLKASLNNFPEVTGKKILDTLDF